ncbi:hypothetical protein AMTR_s00013p00177390 [Amborella trichopoda]|uniref:Fe2OG dioxygenase domain-containing protein n=1 Tax=Amborella trichopoda TaxID=13333 RepID=W1PIW0_AMBTC|nr:hypothetical protein AMTR_s00013p00177390 [Amborella trichopoda]
MAYEDAQLKRPAADLSEVLDFRAILHSFVQNGTTPPGIFKLNRDFDRPVFCFEERPGFYFIPGAIGIEEQCYWVRESLTSFPQPPNRTNHNAIYGEIQDLFLAVQGQRLLVEVGDPIAAVNHRINSDEKPLNLDDRRWAFMEKTSGISNGSRKSIDAAVLLRKLRWSTLGLQFDWSKRNYDNSLAHNKIPDKLCHLAKKLAAPAVEKGDFKPEAAIVNYFGSDDTLGGHLDDMEEDWSKPIVSISLGCKAIFLLGGDSREDPPIAMFVRSGDVVLMAGPARECFHGIPRIFTNEENAEVSPLVAEFLRQEDCYFVDYIRTSRININIRQVH